MKILSLVLVFLCFCTGAHAQSEKLSECSIQDLAISAALGDVTAQYNMGVEFHQGKVVPIDLAKAAAFWRLAAKGGSIDAHNNLGHLNYYGRGIKKNEAEGIRLWRVAAENGFIESQLHLARAYSDGKFLKTDYIEAYAWAKSGLHFTLIGKEVDFREEYEKTANSILVLIQPRLTKAQLSVAESKAKQYILKFAPR